MILKAAEEHIFVGKLVFFVELIALIADEVLWDGFLTLFQTIILGSHTEQAIHPGRSKLSLTGL